MKIRLLFPLLLAAGTAFAAPAPGAHGPDSSAHRPADPQGLKARLEKAVAERLAHANGAEAETTRDAHGPVPASTGGARTTRAAAGHAGAAHAAASGTAPAEPADVWTDLLAGNRRFILGRPRVRPLVEQRAALARGQHPRAIVLTCADSRVPPELLFDQSLGDLFVVRVAGNVVDSAGLGSIEYAVEHLHARTIVVLGHSGCGAVKAAAAGGDPGSPNLVSLVAHIQPVLRRLSNCFEGEELVERAISANARQSEAEMLARSAILRHAKEAEGLRTVAALYDLETGWVKELK